MAADRISALPLLLGDDPAGTLSACAAEVAALAKQSFAAVPRLDWAGFVADLGDRIKEMFEIDVASVVAGAWNDLREIRDCADRSKHPADETILVPLVDHHVETSFAPYLDIAVGTLPALRVHFKIEVDLEFRGVVVRIQDAAIKGFRAGSCQARASLKCEGIVVVEPRTRPLALPGEITLSPGIPIAPHDAEQPPEADAVSADPVAPSLPAAAATEP